MKTVSFTFTANSQNSPNLRVDSSAQVTFGNRGGNATIGLFRLADDGTTFVPVRLPNTATAAEFATTTVGAVSLSLAPGIYRMQTTAWTSNKTGWLTTSSEI